MNSNRVVHKEDLEQIGWIKGYVKIFHKDLSKIEDFDDLLEYFIHSAMDWVLLYFGREKIDKSF